MVYTRENRAISTRPRTPSTTYMARQLSVSSSRPTATGAVSSAPSGVLSRPMDTAKPRSAGDAQADMVLLMIE